MRGVALIFLATLCTGCRGQEHGESVRAGEEEPPLAPGVTVEIRPGRTQFAMGDPILLDVVYRNDGQGTWEIDEPYALMFYDEFEVRDAQGEKVANPYRYLSIGGAVYEAAVHELQPGQTVTLREYLNDCAALDPGEYVVSPRAGNDVVACGGYWIWGPARQDGRNDYRALTKPMKIRILPARDKKERDAIIADLKALSEDSWGKLLQRDRYARYRPYVTEDNCGTDALRLLAFRREQELLPFWLEKLRDPDAAFATEAIVGLPDRTAVLETLEKLLAKGEREPVLSLYVELKVPQTDDVDRQDVSARRDEIRKRYEEK